MEPAWGAIANRKQEKVFIAIWSDFNPEYC